MHGIGRAAWVATRGVEPVSGEYPSFGTLTEYGLVVPSRPLSDRTDRAEIATRAYEVVPPMARSMVMWLCSVQATSLFSNPCR